MAVAANFHFYLMILVAFLQTLLAGRIYTYLVDYYYKKNREEYTYEKPELPDGLMDMIYHFREAGCEGLDYSLMPQHSVLVEVANEYAVREEMRWLQNKLNTKETSLKILHRMNEPRKHLQEELLRHATKTKRAQELATHIAERIGHRVFVNDYMTKERVARGHTKLVMKDMVRKKQGGDADRKMENVDYLVSDQVDREILEKYMDQDEAINEEADKAKNGPDS